MNRHTNTLAACASLLFVLAAQSLLLAQHLQASVLISLSRLQIDLWGLTFYIMGVFLLASILLNYSQTARTWVFLASALALTAIFAVMLQKGYVAEAALLMGLILALALSNWLKLESDWLVEAVQWVNIYVGLGLLLRPEWFLAAPAYRYFQPGAVRYSFVVVMLVSAAISFLLAARPELGKERQGRFLALPWLIWGLMLCLPLRLPNVILSLGVAAALLLKRFIPWKKLVLRDAIQVGRRFFRLIFTAQAFSLALLMWLLRLLEVNLALPVAQMILVREIIFIGFSLVMMGGVMVITMVNLSINGILSGLSGDQSAAERAASAHVWGRIKASLLSPFALSQGLLRDQINQQRQYEQLLAKQANTERRRMAQLNLLHQINIILENLLDPPVSAQLIANAVYEAFGSELVSVLEFEQEPGEMVVLASSGPTAGTIPQGYRQSINTGLIGRTARLRRTQLASDTRLDPDHIQMENQNSLSELVVPMLHRRQLRGVIVLDHAETNVFDDSDIRTLETVAAQLVTSWERSAHDQRLTDLINAGISLSTTRDVETVLKEIAEIVQKILEARFVFVALADKGGQKFTRTTHVGEAPTLLPILQSDPDRNILIQTALNNASAFRLRDVRKRFASTPTGSNELRSLLAIPINMHQSQFGAILAFGKQGDVSFSETDESLASLVAMQAAAAIVAAKLNQELSMTLANVKQLNQLSRDVLVAEELTSAAASMAEVAYQTSKAQMAGIILLTPEKEIEARIQVDASGKHPGAQHPMELVEQIMDMEGDDSIIVPGPNDSTRLCLPIKTPRRRYGVLWVDVPEKIWHDNPHFGDNLKALVNQAAITLERSILLTETRKQAAQLEAAYRKLELTYDQTLAALSSALDARDQETEDHSLRVSRMACALGRRMGITDEQSKIMERGALLHDIGKIGISDAVLLKPGKLNEEERALMRQHPEIGAHIIEGIPFLQDAMPVIRYHQERWDGSGYPKGLKGAAIPLMARIFGVVDVFDALTSNRPYRTPMALHEAVEHIQSGAGTDFDPAIVTEFVKMAQDGTLESLV